MKIATIVSAIVILLACVAGYILIGTGIKDKSWTEVTWELASPLPPHQPGEIAIRLPGEAFMRISAITPVKKDDGTEIGTTVRAKVFCNSVKRYSVEKGAFLYEYHVSAEEVESALRKSLNVKPTEKAKFTGSAKLMP